MTIKLDDNGVPTDLVGGGYHFWDLPCQQDPQLLCRRNSLKHSMREKIVIQGLKRQMLTSTLRGRCDFLIGIDMLLRCYVKSPYLGTDMSARDTSTSSPQ